MATSPSLIPDLVRNRDLSHAVDPRVTKAFYGFGLTPYHGVKRLLPNHFLDLETFASVRHWPPSGLAPYMPEAEAADRLVAGVAALLRDIGSRFDAVRISLSAGRDSRAVLALCRPLVAAAGDKVTAFTTRRGDVWSRVDVATAAKLAERAGIRHEIVEGKSQIAATDEEVARAFVRFGEAKWGPILKSAAASTPPKGGSRKIHLPGMGGEVARGYYWDGRMPRPQDVEPPALLRRVGMPAVPETVAAAAAWLEGLPDAVRGAAGGRARPALPRAAAGLLGRAGPLSLSRRRNDPEPDVDQRRARRDAAAGAGGPAARDLPADAGGTGMAGPGGPALQPPVRPAAARRRRRAGARDRGAGSAAGCARKPSRRWPAAAASRSRARSRKSAA